MATTKDFIEFVCEQIPNYFNIRYKKMFGEYMVYLNDKPILLVCDNTVFIKKVDELKNIMQNSPTGLPYKGAKEWYILDIENQELTETSLTTLERITKVPVKRK